jgi:group I intron endonuclease
MIIYKTTNLINNKIYIGKDKHNNLKYLGSGIAIKSAIEKYGKNNFKKEIIEECFDNDILNEKEKYWINKFNSTNRKIGYNIAYGGEGGDTISNNLRKDTIGINHSQRMIEHYKNNPPKRKEYVRKKDNPNWVNPNKDKKRTGEKKPSNKKGIPNPKHSKWMTENNPFKGKCPSNENVERFKKMIKLPKSEEHKHNLSESLKGHKPGNIRKVIVLGIEYESLTDAARKIKIPTSTMKNRLKSKNKKFKNYTYFL